MTLNAYLSRSGACSRRMAVEIIRQGRVTVDGRVAACPSRRVSGHETVCLDGKRIVPAPPVCLALHKPAGYTCTLRDRHASRKISELLPARFSRLYPAGRLDRQSRGLVIMTSDGFFAHRLMHPSFGQEKEYLVRISPPMKVSHLSALREGVIESGEVLRARRAKILKSGRLESEIELVLAQGRKREVRRMLGVLGYRVEDLLRVRVGPFRLDGLPQGQWRHLEPGLVDKVRQGCPG